MKACGTRYPDHFWSLTFALTLAAYGTAGVCVVYGGMLGVPCAVALAGHALSTWAKLSMGKDPEPMQGVLTALGAIIDPLLRLKRREDTQQPEQPHEA